MVAPYDQPDPQAWGLRIGVSGAELLVKRAPKLYSLGGQFQQSPQRAQQSGNFAGPTDRRRWLLHRCSPKLSEAPVFQHRGFRCLGRRLFAAGSRVYRNCCESPSEIWTAKEAKYRGLSTSQRTMGLSAASVEMTFLRMGSETCGLGCWLPSGGRSAICGGGCGVALGAVDEKMVAGQCSPQ